MKKIAFIDRDGVVNIDYGYVNEPKLFNYVPGCVNGLLLLSSMGYQIVIVTNQSGIARGYFSEKKFNSFMNWMLLKLKNDGVLIRDFFYCPHQPNTKCLCRKPATGMVPPSLAKEYSREHSIMIGDKQSDYEFACNLKLKNFFHLSAEKIIKSDPLCRYNYCRDWQSITHMLKIL